MHEVDLYTSKYGIISCIAGFLAGPNQAVISLKWGVTKHRNGMERNRIYRNKPEYTGTRQNDAGMTPKYTEMSRNEAGMRPE